MYKLYSTLHRWQLAYNDLFKCYTIFFSRSKTFNSTKHIWRTVIVCFFNEKVFPTKHSYCLLTFSSSYLVREWEKRACFSLSLLKHVSCFVYFCFTFPLRAILFFSRFCLLLCLVLHILYDCVLIFFMFFFLLCMYDFWVLFRWFACFVFLYCSRSVDRALNE